MTSVDITGIEKSNWNPFQRKYLACKDSITIRIPFGQKKNTSGFGGTVHHFLQTLPTLRTCFCRMNLSILINCLSDPLFNIPHTVGNFSAGLMALAIKS